MTNPRPRPTSSPTSSQPGDDLPEVTSSLVPHPVGGRGHCRPSTTPPTTTPPPRPRDEVNRHHPDCPSQHPAPITQHNGYVTVTITACLGCTTPDGRP